MEPITHALISAAIARAGLRKHTPLAAPIAVVAGLIADVDALSLLGSPETYLDANRTATHSLVGTVVLAAAVGVAVWFAGRRREKPVCLVPALVVSFVAALVHLLLDTCNSYGTQLLWPFSRKWFAWDLLDPVDPWVLVVLFAGLLLPGLFRMVSEEIGARPAERGAQRWTILTLAMLLLYAGVRFVLHGQAMTLLNSNLYHGAAPARVGAFPWAASPLVWHGVVATENTLEEIDVPAGPAGYFSPERSRTHFKPESSPPLEAARRTEAVQKFLTFARFPTASVDRLEEGYQVTLRDLRFPEESRTGRNLIAVVELDNSGRILHEEIRFASSKR